MRKIFYKNKYSLPLKYLLSGAILLSFLVFGILIASLSYRLVKHGTITSGVVVSHKTRVASSDAYKRSAGPSVVHKSVVEYTDLNGDKLQFTSHFGGPRPEPIGKVVKVVYIPEDKNAVEVYSFSALWFFPVILLAFSIIGFIFFFPSFRKTFASTGFSPKTYASVYLKSGQPKIVTMHNHAEQNTQHKRETASKNKDFVKKS